VEIPEYGSVAMMRRSVPPPYLPAGAGAAALDDMQEDVVMDHTDGSHFALNSALATARKSGLLATLHSHGEQEKPQPLGTMVLLVDSDDEAEMKELEETLVPSLILSLKFRTPITILYSGSREPVEDAAIKLKLNPSVTLSLVDVSSRVEQFAQENIRKRSFWQRQGKHWKLDEFWAMHVHLLPELQKFHYAWRLSPKSQLTGDVSTDLFEVMRQQKAVFGYRLLRKDRQEACAGLQAAAQDFYQENANLAPQSVGARAFLEMYEQAQCPLWTPDFQIVNLDYLRQSEGYADWTKYLAEKGGFSHHGWGVPNVQALFLVTQDEPEKMLCMTPWVPGYNGESELGCSQGLGLISFFQGTMKDRLSHVEALQINEVMQTPLAPARSVEEFSKTKQATAPKVKPAEQSGILADLASKVKPAEQSGILAVLGSWLSR
jgi:hypothetical protein